MKIEIRDLNKSFGEKRIFEDFSCTINPKEIIIITGESGSGKTTLLNIIGGLEPFSGTILYNGKQVSKSKEFRSLRKENISYIFQNFGLIDNETVYDNFSVIPQTSNVKKHYEEIDNALQQVGLEGFGNREVYTLSGGEQQRVSVAKALVKKSKIILADEPTASVDKRNKEEILKLLLKLNEEGSTIILVTHDLELINNFPKVIEIRI